MKILNKKLFLISLLILISLIACADEEATPQSTQVLVAQATDTAVLPSPTPTPTNTPTNSTTPTPEPPPTPQPTNTATPTPAPSPTLSISVYAQTPVPPPQQEIEPDNVKQITELARWGRGVINDIAISGDGRWLAVGTATGVYIHDAQDLNVTIQHLETSSTVNQVAISPDGTGVAVYLIEDVIQLWDVAANQINHEIPLTAMALDFSPSGEYLAIDHSGGDGEGAHIILTTTGEIVQTYPDFPWAQFSPDGKELLVWKYGLLARYQWPENILLDNLEPSDGGGSAIGNAQYFSDSKFIMSSLPVNPGYGTTGDILVHHGAKGNLLYEIEAIDALSLPRTFACGEPIVLADPPASPQPWQLEISADGTISAFVYRSRGYGQDSIKRYSSIGFYRRENGQLLFRFDEDIQDMVMVPESHTWIAALEDGRIQRRSLTNNAVIESIDLYDASALHTAISSNNEYISVEYTDEVKIFRTENGEQIYHYPARRAAFAPDNETVLLGYEDGRLEIRNLSDNQPLRTIYAHSDAVTAVAFLPEGEIVSTGLDCGFHVWNPADGRLVQSFENYLMDSPYTEGELWPVRIWNLTVIQDTFLVGPFNRSMGIWRLENGELLSVVDNHNYLSHIASSNNLIAVPGSPLLVGNVTSSGQFQEMWSGYSSRYAVAFSPDGNIVLSGSDIFYTVENRTLPRVSIDFWLAQNGDVIHQIVPGTERVTSLAFAPNGRFFVSTTLDGVLRLWGIP